MLRPTIFAIAMAVALGPSTSSAAPVTSAVTINPNNEVIQHAGWMRQRQHQYFAPARAHRRDEFCYLRGRRGDPRLFMLQQARGCF